MHKTEEAILARKPMHIVTTSFTGKNEVLVGFADGTSAIFEAEELEKLRPTPKQIFPRVPGGPDGSLFKVSEDTVV